MVTGLKNIVPMVVQAKPEVPVNGDWLAGEFKKCFAKLPQAGFNVLGIVT